MVDIKYIQNNEDLGIDYDWNLIRKEYKKLGVPDHLYDPTTAPIERNRYIFNMSIRKVGKTTDWLLFAMVMHKLYKTTLSYIRETEEQTAPKYTRELLNVVNSYSNGKYIRLLTEGKYNSVKIDARRIFYVLRDENGKEIDRSPDPFMFLLSLDNWADYKSTLNIFRGDIIIVDEFVGKFYHDQSFEAFLQILSTVGRGRHSVRCIFLANTIRFTSPWYREFMIQKLVQRMRLGERVEYQTPKGTHIYIEFVEPKKKEEIRKYAALYFGFDNPVVDSIAGVDAVWSLPPSARIRHEPDEKLITNKLRILGDEEMKLALIWDSKIGLHVNVYPATSKIKDDETVLTLEAPENRRELFALGYGEFFRRIWDLYKKNMFRYSDNEIAVVLEDYVNRAKEVLRKKI